VLAADVFVRHAGAVSFAAHKRRELRRSLFKLNQRHPHYRELVRRFRDEDPLRPYRQRLDLARLLSIRQQQAFLMISHNAGGGTEKHVRDLTERLAREGVTAYRLSPDPEHAAQLRLWHENMVDCPNLVFDLDQDYDALLAALQQLGINHVHIHHLLGFPQRMLALLERLRTDMQSSCDVTLHDYYLACPSINLIFESGIFEGEPTQNQCEAWARRHPTAAGRTPLWLWRHQHGRLLRDARRVIAPSADTAERIQRFFPQVDLFVQPHPEGGFTGPSLYLPHSANTPISIALIGRMSDHKGAKLLVQMAQDIKQRGLPIHFHLFGETERAAILKRTGCVTLHGAYKEEELYDLLKGARCHAALFPSVWPETYSFTLSIALAVRLFPICFDLGALSERLRRANWGLILPQVLMRDARSINDRLLMLETPAPPPTVAQALAQEYPSIVRDYYGFINILN
jgi:glycosyltransferase involved in cell wall biosynthesis